MRPMNGHILVRELQVNGSITPAGVVLPEPINCQYEIGSVLAIHEDTDDDGRLTTKLDLGNLVAYRAGAGVAIRVQDTQCRFLFEANVIAVLEEKPMEVPEDGEKH